MATITLTPQQEGLINAYRAWEQAIGSKLGHPTINDRWEVFLRVKDSGHFCGHHDPFHGPCILPDKHPGQMHNDGQIPD